MATLLVRGLLQRTMPALLALLLSALGLASTTLGPASAAGTRSVSAAGLPSISAAGAPSISAARSAITAPARTGVTPQASALEPPAWPVPVAGTTTAIPRRDQVLPRSSTAGVRGSRAPPTVLV